MNTVLGNNVTVSNMKLINETRDNLRKKYNMKDVDDFTAVEVDEIYEEMEINKALGSYQYRAEFPSECTSFMDNSDSFIRQVDFDIISGGSDIGAMVS